MLRKLKAGDVREGIFKRNLNVGLYIYIYIRSRRCNFCTLDFYVILLRLFVCVGRRITIFSESDYCLSRKRKGEIICSEVSLIEKGVELRYVNVN